MRTKYFLTLILRGGVAITFRDANKKFGAIGTFTKYPFLNEVLNKVRHYSSESMESIVSVRGNYRFSPFFLKRFQLRKGKSEKVLAI